MNAIKTAIASAVLTVAGLTGAHAEYKGSSVANSNGVISSSGAAATSSMNGSSFSSAGNMQIAVSGANSGATTTNTNVFGQPVKVGSANASGGAITGTASYATNVSTGNASGEAGAGGASLVNLSSSGYYDMHGTNPQGQVAGSLGSISESAVHTGTNGSAYAIGGNAVGYSGSATSIKVGNTDHFLANVAVTNANAGSISGSTSGHSGSGSVGLINVGGSAVVNATSQSGNTISGGGTPGNGGNNGGGNNGGCQGSGNCGNGNGNGGGNGTGNEGNGNG
jgi:hypothetical protein